MVCGPIEEVFLYHVGDLVGGGANFMVECLRMAMKDLAERLAFHKDVTGDNPMVLPRRGVFHFDNCPSENKVLQ